MDRNHEETISFNRKREILSLRSFAYLIGTAMILLYLMNLSFVIITPRISVSLVFLLQGIIVYLLTRKKVSIFEKDEDWGGPAYPGAPPVILGTLMLITFSSLATGAIIFLFLSPLLLP